MKKILLLLLIFCDFSLIAQESSPLEADQWKGYGYSPKTGIISPDSLFKISDGVIHLAGPNPGYLMSADNYTNYELTAEFRWIKDQGEAYAGKKKNCGLMYHVPIDQKDTLWPAGIQFQIKEKNTGDFVLLKGITLTVSDTICGPGPSVVVKKKAEAENAIGEWNQIKIVTKGDVCKQYLNNTLVNEGQLASEIKGRILLQFEGYPVDFRNIQIVPLNALAE